MGLRLHRFIPWKCVVMHQGQSEDKLMTKKVIGLALGALLFALSVSAHAQQGGKIFRIGLLDGGTAGGSAVLWEAFRQELNKLG
jgi:hypothetical protein